MGRQIGCDRALITSRDGFFKIVEFALSLIILIIVSETMHWKITNLGSVAFVQFTASFCSATLVISLIIYFFKLYNMPLVSKLPWKLLEIIFAFLCAIFYIISMGICGWVADNYGGFKYGSFVTSAILSAVSTLLFLFHAFLIYRSGTVRSQTAAHEETHVNT